MELDLGLFDNLNDAARKAVGRVSKYLVEKELCDVVSRDSYISFSINGDLVAIAQKGDVGIDMAIALPFDESEEGVFDALDLKWRNLPTGLVIRDSKDVTIAKKFLKKACGRVRSGEVIEIDGSNYRRPEGTFQPQFKNFK